MDERERFYITTAIDYPNSRPHIGTAFEKIGADVQARFRRMEGCDGPLPDGQRREHHQGDPPRHGSSGSSPRPTATTWPGSSRRSGRRSTSRYDDFIQTSEERHHAGCRKFIQTVYDTGDIYKGVYAGRYCTGCEAFKTEKEVAEAGGQLPASIPTRRSSWVEEENYFFRLSAFRDRLLELLRRASRVHPAREPAQRDRQPRRDRAQGRHHHPHGVHLGHPGPVRPRADDLRLVRRPAELHHGDRLRHRRGAVPPLLAGRRPLHRQGHHPLPLRPLAGDADVGRASSCPARSSGTASSTARTRRPARSRS